MPWRCAMLTRRACWPCDGLPAGHVDGRATRLRDVLAPTSAISFANFAGLRRLDGNPTRVVRRSDDRVDVPPAVLVRARVVKYMLRDVVTALMSRRDRMSRTASLMRRMTCGTP